MGSALELSELYHFRIAGTRLKLYKRVGESYEHVLLKALGYALFHAAYPAMEIERDLGWRYTPDLIALDGRGGVDFWGECGSVGLRKIAWLAKHSRARRIVFFKRGLTDQAAAQFVAQLHGEMAERYRPPMRISLVSFDAERADAELIESGAKIEEVPAAWYRTYDI
jgi:uncharacterized protein YaeQ